MSNVRTLEQKRQEALDKASRLQKRIEKQLDSQKFVLGDMLMKIAEDDPSRIPQILADIERYVTRKVDISRLESFKKAISDRANAFIFERAALDELHAHHKVIPQTKLTFGEEEPFRKKRNHVDGRNANKVSRPVSRDPGPNNFPDAPNLNLYSLCAVTDVEQEIDDDIPF